MTTSVSVPRQLLTTLLIFAVIAPAGDVPKKKERKDVTDAAESAQSAILWKDPTDLETRDLFYGSGGEKRAPRGTTLIFEEEDRKGSNPKLVVRDEGGVKWKLKVGPEARPETSATRFVWALGFLTTDNYLVPQVQIQQLPAHLHRGRELFLDGDAVLNVRLKRNPDGYEKAGIWRWKDDPFFSTREYNGLRVLMAVLNNWDLKDVNNEVLERKKGKDSDAPQRLYVVSDLGDSFGGTHFNFRYNHSKGNLESYRHSKFITHVTPEYVSFSAPARPSMVWMIFDPPQFFSRLPLESLGRRIPRADAKWMGSLLARLSDKQIRDAFRAGGFSKDEIDGFASVVESRIAALNDL